MKPLIFKTKYLDLIRMGKKVQTIRLLKNKPIFMKNQIIKVGNYRIFFEIILKDITQKTMLELSEFDAIQDGFQNLADLKKVLVDIYPEINDTSLLTLFHFKYQ